MQSNVERIFDRTLTDIRAAKEQLAGRIVQAAELIVQSLQSGGGVLIFGNGGSASDAQHIAGELVGRFLKERPALRAQALSADTSVMTAIGNDYGFDYVFARQIEAMGRDGDVAIALSTSGNSPNVVAAMIKRRLSSGAPEHWRRKPPA